LTLVRPFGGSFEDKLHKATVKYFQEPDFPTPFVINCDFSDDEISEIEEKNVNGATKHDTVQTKRCSSGKDCKAFSATMTRDPNNNFELFDRERVIEVAGDFDIDSAWAAKTEDQCTVTVDASRVGGGVHASSLFTCDWTKSNVIACDYKEDFAAIQNRLINCQCAFEPEDANGNIDPKVCFDGPGGIRCPGADGNGAPCLLGVCQCHPTRSGKNCGLNAKWSEWSQCACNGDREMRKCTEKPEEVEKGGIPCAELSGGSTRNCRTRDPGTPRLTDCPTNAVPKLNIDVPANPMSTVVMILIVAGSLLFLAGTLVLVYAICFYQKKAPPKHDLEKGIPKPHR